MLLLKRLFCEIKRINSKSFIILSEKTEKLSIMRYYIRHTHNMIYFDKCII